MATVAVVAAMPAAAGAREPRLVLKRTFNGPDGLITNAYATWTDNPLAHHSGDWRLEGGSLFRLNNSAWTGVPTCGRPDLLSTVLNGSNKLRVHMVRRVPANALVTSSLRVARFTGGCADRPAAHWNQVSFYLRRVDGDNFYVAGVSARDGRAYIEKKVGGSVYLLAGERGHPALFGRWDRVGGSVRTERSGSVTIEVIRHGKVVLRAHDRGRGGPPITAAGQTGFRSDNVQFALDNFAVWRLR